MHILITGATSMLGLSIINLFLTFQDITITCLVNPGSHRKQLIPKNHKITIIELENAKYDNLHFLINNKVIDILFHFSWASSGTNRDKTYQEQLNNVNSAALLLESVNKLTVKKFVVSGSQAEYGLNKNATPKSEDDSIQNVSFYGLAKLMTHSLFHNYSITHNIPLIWLRIFSVYGINDRKDSLISYLINKMVNNEEINISECEQKWEYIYETDAANMIFLLATKENINGTFNISTGDPNPLIEYIKVIKKSFPDFNNSFNFNKESSKHNLVSNTNKLNSTILYKPKFSFEAGINQIINSFKKT
jgi:nucleoside-diphosphate-sugar epimerase